MLSGHLQFYKFIFTYSALLLFKDSFCEALSCQHVVHKKVGDTLELSSCLPPEGVTVAQWRYEGFRIADKDKDRLVDEKQFKGRLNLSLTDFSLTVKDLKLKYSGEYRFISEANNIQRKSVTVTLKVHEPLTEPPELTRNSIWDPSTNSCTVLLECSSKSAKNISYKWTIGDQTKNGSRLQHTFTEQDGDTTFNCTIYNPVSETSATRTLECFPKTQEIISPDNDLPLVNILIVAGSVLLVVVVVTAVVCHCKRSKADQCRPRVDPSQTVNQDETQQPVYSSLLHGDADVYETLRDYENAGSGASPSAGL